MPIPLSPNHGSSSKTKEKPFAVFDIEAYKWTQFKVCGWYNGENYKTFRSMKAFLHFAWEQPEKIIYAHFGGIYDFMFVLEEAVKASDYRIGSMIPRGSGILGVDLFRDILDADGRVIGEEKLQFKDSSALMPFSLKKLTESFGVEHKKQEFDFNKWDGKVTPILLEYLKDDCRGLYECIKAFNEWPLIKKAGPAQTIASQSLRVFRLYLKDRIYSLKPVVDNFVRKSYFGGRTEVFKPHFKSKSKNIYCYDVNSLYPTVMEKNQYPTNFAYWTLEYEKDSMGFYECDVDVPKDMYLPPLPVVKKVGHSEKLIFPTGKFSGVYTTIEINYARSLGVKIKTGKGAIFKNGGYLFKGYINDLYAMRREAQKKGDGVGDLLCKLMMNGLYGRFGLVLEREQVIFDDFTVGLKPLTEIEVTKNGRKYCYRLMTKKVQLDSSFSNVAISSWVTSHSRIYMHKLMNPISKHLYYTDSVTSDRMMAIKINDNISVKTIEEIFDLAQTHNEIQTVSWNPESSKAEWQNINKVIRHKTNKQIYETRDNKGASWTTEDHSFIDINNTKLKPNQVSSLFSVKNLSNLEFDECDKLDLVSILPSTYDGFNSFYELNYDSEYCWYDRKIKSKRLSPLKKISKVKRYYEGQELKNLLKVLGYFIAEGSVTDKETGCRFCFSIASDKTDLHDELIIILRSMFDGCTFSHIKSSKMDNTYKIINGSYLPVIVFKHLGGQTSFKKFIPDFVFNLSNDNKKLFLNWLVKGDGSVIFPSAYSEEYKDNNFRYSTSSKELINKLSFLISQLDICHSIQYRSNKNHWTITTSSKNRDKNPILKAVEYSGYVYDLEVEKNNNFFDCEGMIGLHNTDSLFTTKEIKGTDSGLGGLKLEYKGKEAVFLLPKTYVVQDEQSSFKKVAMKGFDSKKISKFQYEDFLVALEGDLRLMKVTHDEKMAKMKSAIKKGSFLTMQKAQEKQLRARYDKRTLVHKRGTWDTVPLHFS